MKKKTSMKKIFVKPIAKLLAIIFTATLILSGIAIPTLAAPSATRNIFFGTYNLLENNTIANIVSGTKAENFRAGVTLTNGTTLNFKKSDNSPMAEGDLLTTGSKIEVVSGATTTYTALIYGDCDKNGAIGVNDLALLKSHILKQNLLSGIEFDSVNFAFGSSLSISNLLKLKKQIMGIETINQANLKSANKIVTSGEPSGNASIYANEPNDVTKSAYLAMQGAFVNEKFEFTTTIKDGAAPNLVIGARMAGVSNNPDAYDGAAIRFYNGFFEVYAPKYGTWVDAVGLTFTSNTEYEFLLDVTTEISVTTLNLVIKQGATIVLTYSKEIVAAIPASGSFAVWSMDKTTEIGYKLYQDVDKVFTSEQPIGSTRIITSTPGNIANTAYLAMQGAFVNEKFEFTTTIANGANPNLVVGARLAGVGNNPDDYNGAIIHFYNGFFELYAPGYGAWVDALGMVFTSNTEYKFTIGVTTENGFTTLSLLIKQGETTVLNYSKGIEVAIPASGSFGVWSLNETTDISYKLSDVDKVVMSNGTAGTAKIITSTQNNIATPAFLAMQGNYTNEQFEFTTTIKDGASPNIVLGARMDGFERNPDKDNGVTVRFYGGFIEVYAPIYGWWAGAEGVTLASNTEYTFGINVTTVNSVNTLNVFVKQGNTVVFITSKVISATIPVSGSFVVWSMDDIRDIAYTMPVNTAPPANVNVVVPSTGAAGTADISTIVPNVVAESAFLAIDGNYTNEKFEFTTTVKTGTDPNLVLGARMAGFQSNPDKNDGVTIAFYDGFFEVYAKRYGWWRGAYGASLASNTAYTFIVDVTTVGITNTLHLVVKQGSNEILNYSLDLGEEVAVPASGSFVVWSMDEDTQINYLMPHS